MRYLTSVFFDGTLLANAAHRVTRTVHSVALALAPALFSFVLHGGTSTSTILSSSLNPSTFGQSVTITAQVSPAAATGKVTIYDGVTILGIAALSGGQATLNTALLPTGVRSLTAYYAGDSGYSASTSRPLQQTVNGVGAKAYQISASYQVGQSPRWLTTSDFNGDGNVDLAVVNESSNTVSILLGKGNGTFAPAGTYIVGFDPVFIATGDFNADGNVDLVVVSLEDSNPNVAQVGSLSVLLGNGDGTFQASRNLPTKYAPTQVAAADFNSDGTADFAVTDVGSGDIDVFTGDGDGMFQPTVDYLLFRAASLTVGDFNGDGKADLAVSNSNDGNIYIYLGKGDGTFGASQTRYPTSEDNGVLASSDLNGDGNADLVMAGQFTGKVYVSLGNGDGTFRPAVSYAVGQLPSSVTISDLNGDGIPDLVVANWKSDTLSILYGVGDGTFEPQANFGANPLSANPAFFGPQCAVVGDFNGDGIPDFAVANYGYNEVTIVLGRSSLAPDLTISKTHSGTFAQGQKGATYTIVVSNVGLSATSAQVSVVDALPAGLAATAIGGAGWSCTLTSLTCTRADALMANGAYPPITVTVNIAIDAPVSVTNMASVSGGGENNTGNDSASDITAIHQSNAPVLSVGGIINASGNSGTLPASPGSLISIFGSNLAASAQNASADTSGRLPFSLAGASLLIGSMSAPLLYISPTQINAQVPFGLTPGAYSVSVTTSVGGPSNSINLAITATSPGMFAGAVVNNATGAAINTTNPLRPGDVIVVYGTGLGVVSPSGITGQLALGSPVSSTNAVPTVTIGGLPVQVANSVLAPGFVGLYQIGIIVPAGLPQGVQPLAVTAGGVTAPSIQVFSGPSLIPNYCADVSGVWNVTQSGSVTETATSAIENDNFTNPFSSQGSITIVQTGCSITYVPTPIPGLVTADQAAALARTGTVVGASISLQGLLTTAALAVANQSDLTITSISQNQLKSSGQVTGALIKMSDTGNFSGSGTYSFNGQSGSFTLTYALTGSSTLVRPGVGPIASGSAITTATRPGTARFAVFVPTMLRPRRGTK